MLHSLQFHPIWFRPIQFHPIWFCPIWFCPIWFRPIQFRPIHFPPNQLLSIHLYLIFSHQVRLIWLCFIPMHGSFPEKMPTFFKNPVYFLYLRKQLSRGNMVAKFHTVNLEKRGLTVWSTVPFLRGTVGNPYSLTSLTVRPFLRPAMLDFFIYERTM